MIRTLAIKELRETLWLPGLALFFCYWSFPTRMPSGISFFTFEFDSAALMLYPALAIVLGFRQSVWEAWRDTYVYLLSRPVRWRTVIGVKLATGLTLVLVASAIPILLIGWWASTPGNFAGPFEWSMTETAWKLWAAMGPLYLAAFLCGIRPGNWFGTRLWPLVGVSGLLVPIFLLPWWPILGLGANVLLSVGLVLCVMHVVRTRDY